LGAGIAIAVGPVPTQAQQRGGGRGGGETRKVAARIHPGRDGVVTVMSGKVELGQGARAELSQAAAEEFRVPVSQIQVILADTSLVPDDGLTAGSRTTPSTVPLVRRATAARNLLAGVAAQRWSGDRSTLEVRDGRVVHSPSNRTLSYSELAGSAEVTKVFAQAIPPDVTATAVKEWKILVASVARPNARDLVTGAHRFPSDIQRPRMVYGKVLRPPAYGAKLVSVELAPTKVIKDVIAVQDGQFVGVAAPSTLQAERALEAIARTAKWETAPRPSSQQLFEHLRNHARGGMPSNPLPEELASASKKLQQSYRVPYVQHAPMEAARRFNWRERVKRTDRNLGVGLACGTITPCATSARCLNVVPCSIRPISWRKFKARSSWALARCCAKQCASRMAGC
jgi:isoquinoline 1-oxidoreductase